MKNRFIKIVLLMLLVTNTFAYANPQQNYIVDQMIKANKALLPKEVTFIYENFKVLVANKINYDDLGTGYIFFKESNRNLLIGSSGAVFCGHTMGEAELSKYGYDVIGFGGVFDYELIQFLQLLGDKKYDNIVVFGGVNDLNIRVTSNLTDVDTLYCTVLNDLLSESVKHINNSNSKVVYIKIRPMVLNVDLADKDFVDRYNNMAKEINDNIDYFGYRSYMIPYDTTTKYSQHYIHYDNKVVYEDLFSAVNAMK